MKKKKYSLLNTEPDNLLVTPQKAPFPIQYVPEDAEPDKFFEVPLSNGAKKIVRDFKNDIEKISPPKLQPTKGSKQPVSTDSEYYTCEEIAAKLNLSLKEVKRQIYEHQIVGQQKVFGKWLVHKQTFDKWLLRERQIEVKACRRK